VGFSTITTITFSADSGTAIDTGLSAVAFSFLNATYPSVPANWKSAVGIYASASTTSLSSGTPLLFGTGTPGGVVMVDVLSEFSSTVFTPKRYGIYLFNVYWEGTLNGATLTTPGTNGVLVYSGNGGVVSQQAPNGAVTGVSATATAVISQATGVASLAAGQTLLAEVQMAFTGGPIKVGNWQLTIVRVS